MRDHATVEFRAQKSIDHGETDARLRQTLRHDADRHARGRLRQAGSAAAPKAEAPKAAAAPAAPEPLKVGFVYVSPVGDAGWTSQQSPGTRRMLKTLGDKATSTYVEKVPEGADAERVIRDLAQQGHKLIFTTSFGFMNPTLKVAEEFKDVKFEHATATRRPRTSTPTTPGSTKGATSPA